MQTNYSFTDQYKSSRSGFSHTSQFLINGVLISEAKINYINRTWERYTYQTSRRNAVAKAVEERLDYLCQSYKKDNNLTRLPNGYRNSLKDTDETIKTYIEIYKTL